MRSALRLALMGGTAVAVAFAASAAQAQCTGTPRDGVLVAPGFLAPFRLNYPADAARNIAAAQALIGVISTTSTAFQNQTTGFVGSPQNPLPDQPGGGVWMRGIGGFVDTNTPGSYSVTPSTAPSPSTLVVTNPGSTAGNCNTRTSQNYGGVQVGADIARLNVGGANFFFGAIAGYTDAFVSSPTGVQPATFFGSGQPGTVSSRFNAGFQTPFAGVYGVMTYGSLFADAALRADFYHARQNEPANGIFDQGINARSLTGSGNVGYNFTFGDSFFVEPSAGINYTTVNVDRFNLGGTFLLLNNNGAAPPSSVKIQDFDSILGRASIRFGKNFATDTYVVQPFITASVFNEFAGAVRTTISTTFDPLLGNGNGLFSPIDAVTRLSTGRIGTYGQFSGGVSAAFKEGWLGYVRADYRVGDRVDGFGVSGGLRYQFTPELLASRGIVRKGYDAGDGTPVPVIPVVNWTGLSVGAALGGTLENVEKTLTFNGIGTGRTTVESPGFLIGGQAGYDYQFGNVVVGVGGGADYVSARGTKACPTNAGTIYNCETRNDLLAMATGRIGYAMDRSLFYLKGGAAFGDIQEDIRPTTGAQPLFLLFATRTALPSDRSTSRIGVGWTAGAGFEFALTNNWSAKAEYMHYELERRRVAYPNLAANYTPTTESVSHSGDLVRVGVNYRFNFGGDTYATAPARAVVAKY